MQAVLPSQLKQLRELSIQTFVDTFAADNTPENMQRYLSESLSETRLSEELANESSAFYFALDADKVIGYLKLNFGDAQTEWSEAPSMEIERIYVLKTHHGKEAGKAILDFALNQASERKLTMVWLGVWEKNLRAIRFYEKHGFRIFSKHTFMLGDDEQTDLMMKKDLT